MTNTTKTTQPKFLRGIATALSYILHPVFMPLYMTLALYRLAPVSFTGVSDKDFIRMLAQIVQLTIFYPLLVVVLLKGLGFIKSILMHDPKERIVPLMATMIFYFWVYWVFRNTASPFILKVLLLGTFWGVIAIFMLNIFFKISMHATAAGSMIGILIVLMRTSPVNMVIPFFIALVVAGIMGTSRLILGAHRLNQVVAGYILGLLVMLTAYGFLV